MKRIYVISITTLNLYYLARWTQVFYFYANPYERSKAFMNYWPLFDKASALNIVLMVLSAASLIVIWRQNPLKHSLKILFSVFNTLFILFALWSSL